ncbi:hypothetical protein TTHERM_01014580 (macronuclear) [Tetrahymena thermophila SB210]|uniref:Uncharacterized protein n=1 Tax=Tetrahymena thermophila (strain SB210) TaxID=312017 RepID=Q22CX8_TETTS|nr:hypothetical protein TTHERM_01014580 [Tetrahymena thermophila SB210]EAR83141.3 hypothetical protein TTHERM_01014580 [Tetrahymena thermophila SB210]|eukprot:XP_001030804.3 hypothetical protein TTHERM_01014580 [Tetrahymena thermophila SB210]
MRENYYRIANALLIFIKLILRVLDETTNILYVIEVPFSIISLQKASIFFLLFSPVFQSISWAFIQGQIDLITLSLDNKKGGYIFKKLELSNWADQSPNIFSYYGRSLVLFLFELSYQIYYIIRNLPHGFLYGFFSELKMLTFYFYFKMKDNNLVTASYEDLFVRQLKNELEKVRLEVLSRIRKDVNEYNPDEQPEQKYLTQKTTKQQVLNTGEETAKYSAAIVGGGSSYVQSYLLNSLQGNQNYSEGIDEMEYFEIMRVQGIIYFMTNEKIQKIAKICEFIEFIFESLPFLILQFINNEAEGWENNSRSLTFGATFTFITSFISALINTIQLLNFLVQKEGLSFLFMHRIFANNQKELETYYSQSASPKNQPGSEIHKDTQSVQQQMQQQIIDQQNQLQQTQYQQLLQQQALQQQLMFMQQNSQNACFCNNPACYNFANIFPTTRGFHKSSLKQRSQLFLTGTNSYQDLNNLILTPANSAQTYQGKRSSNTVIQNSIFGGSVASTINNTLNIFSLNQLLPQHSPNRVDRVGMKSMTFDNLNFGTQRNVYNEMNQNHIYTIQNFKRGSHNQQTQISEMLQFENQNQQQKAKESDTHNTSQRQDQQLETVLENQPSLQTQNIQQQQQQQITLQNAQQSTQGNLKLTNIQSILESENEENLLQRSAQIFNYNQVEERKEKIKLRPNLSLNINGHFSTQTDYISPPKKVQLNLVPQIGSEIKPVQMPYQTKVIKSMNMIEENLEKIKEDQSQNKINTEMESNNLINEPNNNGNNIGSASKNKDKQFFFPTQTQMVSQPSDEGLSAKGTETKAEMNPTINIIDLEQETTDLNINNNKKNSLNINNNFNNTNNIQQLSKMKNRFFLNRQSSADVNNQMMLKQPSNIYKNQFEKRIIVRDKDNTLFGNQSLGGTSIHPRGSQNFQSQHQISQYQQNQKNIKHMYQKKSLLDLVKIKKDISIIKVYDPKKAEAISILKQAISNQIKEITFSFPKQKVNSSDIIYYLTKTQIINVERFFLNLCDCNIKSNDIHKILDKLLGEKQKLQKLRAKRSGLIQSQLQKIFTEKGKIKQIKAELQQFYLNIDENESLKKDQNNILKYFSLDLKQIDLLQPTYFIIESPYSKKNKNLKRVYQLIDQLKDSFEKAGQLEISSDLIYEMSLCFKRFGVGIFNDNVVPYYPYQSDIVLISDRFDLASNEDLENFGHACKCLCLAVKQMNIYNMSFFTLSNKYRVSFWNIACQDLSSSNEFFYKLVKEAKKNIFAKGKFGNNTFIINDFSRLNDDDYDNNFIIMRDELHGLNEQSATNFIQQIMMKNLDENAQPQQYFEFIVLKKGHYENQELVTEQNVNLFMEDACRILIETADIQSLFNKLIKIQEKLISLRLQFKNKIDVQDIKQIQRFKNIKYLFLEHQSFEHEAPKNLPQGVNKRTIGNECAKSISDSLQNLSNLYVFGIKMKSNNLSYEGVKHIANGLFEQQKLCKLSIDLTSNYVDKESCQALSQSIKSLDYLNELDLQLGSNQIGNEGMQHMFEAVQDLEQMTQISYDFSKNNIDHESCNILQEYLKCTSQISTLSLNLSQNSLSKEGTIGLSNGLKNLTSLQSLHLYLDNNKIEYEGAAALSEAIKELRYLHTLYLDLSENKIGKQSCSVLSEGFKCLYSMVTFTLKIKNNDIQVQGISCLLENMKQLTGMQQLTLDVGWNDIGNEGAKAIGVGIMNFTYLQQLSLTLSKNEIKIEGAQSICQGLKFLSNLENIYIDLTWNYIGDKGTVYFSDALSKMNNLQTVHLDFHKNQVSDFGAQSLGKSLRQLKKITDLHLDLTSNQIGQSGAERLVHHVRKLYFLQKLNIDISDNNFDYKLFDWINQL